MYNLYDLNFEGAKQSAPIHSSNHACIPEEGVRFTVYTHTQILSKTASILVRTDPGGQIFL